jgi:microcystin-dependent protein
MKNSDRKPLAGWKAFAAGVLISSGLVHSQASAGTDAYLGEISWFAGTFAPIGWTFCSGQLLQIDQNTALFSLLGTTYGGDGRTTFGLPDLRGRVPIHPGNGPGLSDYRQGNVGGTEAVTLSTANLPSHSHSLVATSESGNKTAPDNTTYIGTPTLPLQGNPEAKLFTTPVADPVVAPTALAPASIGNTGGGQPVTNIQPYATIQCIIATQGIYPSR